MKYCDKCKKELETKKDPCPICKADFPNNERDVTNEYEAAEIISTMMTTGIL